MLSNHRGYPCVLETSVFETPLLPGKGALKFLSSEEIIPKLREAKVLVERWRQEYNSIRPHSSLGYRPPAPEAIQPTPIAPKKLQAPTLRKGEILT